MSNPVCGLLSCIVSQSVATLRTRPSAPRPLGRSYLVVFLLVGGEPEPRIRTLGDPHQAQAGAGSRAPATVAMIMKWPS
jgi:hypothetical protein